MLNMSAPHESGAADASQHLADEIQARCRDLSSVLDECCTMVRQRDDMIRDDGRKIDELEKQLDKFKHYYYRLNEQLRQLEEEQDAQARKLKGRIKDAEQRTQVCPTLRLHVDAKNKIQSALEEIEKDVGKLDKPRAA